MVDVSALLAWVCLAGATSIAAAAATQKPHIIYVLADDLGHANVGWNNKDVMTPHLDSLRASGVALDRHFVYKFCSPTRSSLLSGRLPIHVNQENSATEQRYAGIPLNMTTFTERLKAEGGYTLAHAGKWHVGQATPAHTPSGRGFDSSLSFFNFGEDHYTQVRGGEALGGAPGASCKGVDLWKDDGPARGFNGSYGGYLFGKEAMEAINAVPSPVNEHPLFMFIAWQNNHPPLQVPQEYIDRYPAGPLRTTINGMSLFLDESTKNVTDLLKARGMWENTLLVFSGDNGAYLNNGGDSTPLRGGKFSSFDGGVRTPSFVAGGFLPESVRGTSLTGSKSYIHIADWATTFLKLAGVPDPTADPRAEAAGLPGLDSLDVWPLISGANLTSPRREVPLSVLPDKPPSGSNPRDLSYFVGGEGIIVDGYKLVLGDQHIGPFKLSNGMGSYVNFSYPPCNASAGPWDPEKSPGVPCSCGAGGCLYDLEKDPNETHDLAAEKPDVAASLRARVEALRPGVYAPDRGPLEQAACDEVKRTGGFWGPWLPSPRV